MPKILKSLIVAWRGGAPVRLQDVAKVYDSVEYAHYGSYQW